MNILVTGGMGFQGTNLTKALLERGHNVYGLNTPSEDAKRNLAWLYENVTHEEKENHTVLWTSITDDQVLERVIPQVEVIFHLAAKVNVDESIDRPDVFYETNIKGTYNILNLARELKCRVIMASTCEVYGGGKDLGPDSILNPASPYGASKAAGDRIAHVYAETYGVPIDIVRPFNVYGPLQKEGGRGAVIAMFFKKILNGEELTIHGDGNQCRDFIFIDDVVRGYLGILNTPNDGKCNIYTFGTGVETSVNELIAHMADITGKELKMTHTPNRLGQIDTFTAKYSIQDYFGGDESVSVADGLKRYYDFRFKQDW